MGKKKRGIAAEMQHKAKRVAKRRPIEVEDHGNGFMFLGTTSILDAKGLLADYADDPEPYKFAWVGQYKDRSAVWLSTEPGAAWDGATDTAGEPLPR